MKLPIPPSVNHCYKNATVGDRTMRVLTEDALIWMEYSQLFVKDACRRAHWHMPEAGTKIVVELWVRWPDNRRRDLHNLHKMIADALEGAAYSDDRYALLRDMDYDVDRRNPGLLVRFYAK